MKGKLIESRCRLTMSGGDIRGSPAPVLFEVVE